MEYRISQPPLVIDHETLIDVMHGSGWDTFPWWRKVTAHADGTLVIVHDAADDDGTAVARVTPDAFAAMWSKLVDDLVVNEADPADIDAGVADTIVQHVVFGEAVFG